MAISVNPADAGAEPTPQKKSRRKVIWAVLGVIVVIGGLIWLVHWWTVGRFIEDTDDAYLRADSVTIAPKVSGYIHAVYVGDNQTVKAGQALVKLDTRQYQASLDQAQASVDARRADIVKAQADAQQQRAAIEQAKAQAQSAAVNAEHAAHEYERFAPLAATGAETGEKLADLRSTRDQARADYAARRAAVQAAIAQAATLDAQIVQAQAQLEASEASSRASRLDVNDTVVRSAIDGRVGDRTVRVGQYVQPGTRLMTVVPIQDVYVVANYKETQVGAMRIGQQATLHVDALPGRDLDGVIDSFAPGTGSEFALLPPENATGNFTKIVQRVPVRIRINTDAQTRKVLVPGMSVTVDVDTRGAEHAQSAPAASDANASDASSNASASDVSGASASAPSAQEQAHG